MVNYRVQVDWDDDGYFNSGVPPGTPENEVLTSPFYGGVEGRVLNSSNVLQSGRVTEALQTNGAYGHRAFDAILSATSERAEFGLIPPRQVREVWAKRNVLINGEHFSPTVTGASTEYREEKIEEAFGSVKQVITFRSGFNTISFQTPYLHTSLTGNPVISFYARKTTPEAQNFTLEQFGVVSGSTVSMGSVSFTASTNWTRYSFNATTRPDGTGAFSLQSFLTLTRTSGTTLKGGLEFSGYMVADTPLSDYNNDRRYSINDTAFKLYKDNDYVLSVWVKGSGAADFYVRYQNTGATGDYSTSTQTVTLISDYQRVDFDLSGRTDKTAFDQIASIMITNHTGTVTLTGFMLVQGSAIVPYHPGGVTNAYDNITPYVIEGSWQGGRRKFDEFLAHEGELDLTLNNASRFFSPNNEASPLYGNLRQNLRVRIQLYTGGDWVNLWSGWSDTWDITAGTGSDMRVVLHCNQGLFRLREGEFLGGVYTSDVLASDIVKELVVNAGYRAVLSPFAALVGVSTVGDTAITTDTDAIFTDADESIYPVNFIGDGWNRKTKLENAVKDLLDAEQSHLWIDRNGGLVLKNRHYYINRTADFNFSADTEAVQADYAYGSDITNRVEVILKPKKVVSRVTVWETKAALQINALSTRTEKLDFSFEEGSARTITRLYDGRSDMTITGYTSARNRSNTPSITFDAATIAKVDVRVLDTGDNNRILMISNPFDHEIFVDVTIKGDYVEGGNTANYLFDDNEGILLTNGIHKTTVEIPFLEGEAGARGYARYLFSRDAAPHGAFKRIKIIENVPDVILTMTMGKIVAISETQTGEENVLHTIIGENGTISGGYVTMEYDLAWLDTQHYAQVGDNLPAVADYLHLTKPYDVDNAIVLPTIPFESTHGERAYYAGAGGQYRLADIVQEYEPLAPVIESVSNASGNTLYADGAKLPAAALASSFAVAAQQANIPDTALLVSLARTSAGTGDSRIAIRGSDVGSSAFRGRLRMPDAPWSLTQRLFLGAGGINKLNNGNAAYIDIAHTKSGQTPAVSGFTAETIASSFGAGFASFNPVSGRSVPVSNGTTPPGAGDSYGITLTAGLSLNENMKFYIGSLIRLANKRALVTLANANRRFIMWCRHAPGQGTEDITLIISHGGGVLHNSNHSVTENETIIAVNLNNAITSTGLDILITTYTKDLIIMGYALVDGNTTPANYAITQAQTELVIYI